MIFIFPSTYPKVLTSEVTDTFPAAGTSCCLCAIRGGFNAPHSGCSLGSLSPGIAISSLTAPHSY